MRNYTVFAKGNVLSVKPSGIYANHLDVEG